MFQIVYLPKSRGNVQLSLYHSLMECGIVVKHDCAVWQNEAGEVVNSE
jgi:hypothetical protein